MKDDAYLDARVWVARYQWTTPDAQLSRDIRFPTAAMRYARTKQEAPARERGRLLFAEKPTAV